MDAIKKSNVEAARADAITLLAAVLVGAFAGVATWVFILSEHYAIEFLWHELPTLVPGVPAWALGVGVVAITTALIAVIITLVGKPPFSVGEAAEEYDAEGRMGHKHLLSGTLQALLSLASGAAVGPEGALTDINGGLGTMIGDRLKMRPEAIKTMTYAGVAGAFAAFFGAAPVGALLAAEFISPKSVSLNRALIVAGLGSGSSAWVVYNLLGGPTIAPIFTMPEASTISGVDLGIGLALGALGGVLGLIYGAGFVKTRVAMAPLRKRPWLAALAGGAAVAVASVISPYLLFSGQSEMPSLFDTAASLGVLALIGLGVGKLILSIWSISTTYFGGPIFPLIFAGTCFGLAANAAFPAIPVYVAIMAIVTGLCVSASAAPLSVTIFLSLIADPSLTAVIAIAAVAAYVIRQAVSPTIPGVYREARTAETTASS